jgi:hypothetical protein
MSDPLDALALAQGDETTVGTPAPAANTRTDNMRAEAHHDGESDYVTRSIAPSEGSKRNPGCSVAS